MVQNRTWGSLALGVALGSALTLACAESSKLIANIIGDALSIAFNTGTISSVFGVSSNTVQDALDATVTRVGDTRTLVTTAQTSAVAAINEVAGKAGDLAQLATVTKTSLVDAVNEVKQQAATVGAVFLAVADGGVAGTQKQYIGGGVPSNPIGTESEVQIVVPRAGSIGGLAVRPFAAMPAGVNLVVTLRKNGAATAQTLTFVTGDAAPKMSTATAVPVAAGDLVAIELDNTASSGGVGDLNATFELR